MTRLCLFYCSVAVFLNYCAGNAVETSFDRFSSGFFGCRFSSGLCTKLEKCVNDGLFGRCQSVQELRNPYQFRLSNSQNQELDAVLSKLKTDGYQLSHTYTQCILAYRLFAYRFKTLVDLRVCDRYLSPSRRGSFVSDEDRLLNHFDELEKLDLDEEEELVKLERQIAASRAAHNQQKQEGVEIGDFEAELDGVASNDRLTAVSSKDTANPSASTNIQNVPPVVAGRQTQQNVPPIAPVRNVQNDVVQMRTKEETLEQPMPPHMIAVYTIVGIIVVVILVAIGFVVYIFCCKQKRKDAKQKGPLPCGISHDIISTATTKGQLPSRSISRIEEALKLDLATGSNIMNYVEEHLKNKGLMEKVWDSLCSYRPEQSVVVAARHLANTGKNRYSDVLPYEHSRVHLMASTNVFGSDYINASIVTDPDQNSPTYIVSQGPLPHTVADFWQMVWEQGSVVIVNLAPLTENSTELCHRYWPDTVHRYHVYEVKLGSEHTWCSDYCVRTFTLKNTQSNETRTVTQFHYLSWSEDKVPYSPDSLLDFRRKVNNSFRSRSSPVIVHCSDGAGRSGTYCLIDMALHHLSKGAKEIDICGMVRHLRDERVYMVRTKAQLEFAFFAVACEVLQCGTLHTTNCWPKKLASKQPMCISMNAYTYICGLISLLITALILL